MNQTELSQEVFRRGWYQSVTLSHGIVTPGVREANAWELYKLPANLEGKTVLDIGAWEGQFSFEAERRGAAKVVAMDVWGDSGNPGSEGLGWPNFEFCRNALQSNVIVWNKSIYDIEPAPQNFDIVLLISVIYHLQDPFLGIRKAASVCREMLVLETWVDALSLKDPGMVFYEGSELRGDATNWWGPNPKCVEGMLRVAGFKRVEQVWEKPDSNLDGRGKRMCWQAFK